MSVPGLRVGPTTVGGSGRDAAALQAFQDYGVGELSRIRSRSDKWIAGLAAVTGVLTTAIVLKGPDDFTKLAKHREIFGQTINTQDWVIGLMLAGGLLIATGVVLAYTGAHGNPFSEDPVAKKAKTQTLAGASTAWSNAVSGAAKSARRSLASAVVLTLVGTLCLAAAVVLAWTAPSTSSGDTVTCIQNGSSITKISGSLPDVKQGQFIIVPCP
jgi:hypothetical protein